MTMSHELTLVIGHRRITMGGSGCGWLELPALVQGVVDNVPIFRARGVLMGVLRLS